LRAGVTPSVTFTSRIATRNYSVDLSTPRGAKSERRGALEHFLRPTELLPTDGIVKTTATAITRASQTDVDKARAIYEWSVDNTFRNPRTRGCGLGDIRFMLETGHMAANCPALNALDVGLARAGALAARAEDGI